MEECGFALGGEGEMGVTGMEPVNGSGKLIASPIPPRLRDAQARSPPGRAEPRSRHGACTDRGGNEVGVSWSLLRPPRALRSRNTPLGGWPLVAHPDDDLAHGRARGSGKERACAGPVCLGPQADSEGGPDGWLHLQARAGGRDARRRFTPQYPRAGLRHHPRKWSGVLRASQGPFWKAYFKRSSAPDSRDE
jgi:hypothetical protein